MTLYDFGRVMDRSDNFAAKYDELGKNYGRDDLIALWVADMDFPAARPIVDALSKRAAQGIYGYTSRPDAYFQSLIDWYGARYDFHIQKEWLIHSPAVVSSMSMIVRELTFPGDKVLIQTPVYPPFYDVALKNDRELVTSSLTRKGLAYEMDLDDLGQKLADDRVKLMLLCNPHNPVGRVWTREELTSLGELCLEHGVKVVADEIHGDLTLHGSRFTPMASIDERFAANTITCLSASKTFNLAGLHASYVVAPNPTDFKAIDDMIGLLDIRRNNCFSLVAMEAAYRGGGQWLAQLLEYIEGNMTFVTDYCKERIPAIVPNKPEGTYLLWLDCRGLGLDDESLARLFIDEARVALNSGISFGREGSGFMRMNVACPRIILEEALTRIEAAVGTLPH